MLATLRRRLVLSHLLPLLLVVPVMGIALVYVLGTQVLVPSISQDLLEEGRLVARIAEDSPGMWQNPPQAQALVDRLSPELTARLMLIDAQGRIVAARADPAGARVGQLANLPDLKAALAGRSSLRTSFRGPDNAQVADVLVPVPGPGNRVIGVVRVTHQVEGLAARFARLRYLIAVILACSMLLGAAVGWVLALDIERPLREVTQAVYQLASQERPIFPGVSWAAPNSQGAFLPEQGPTEIKQLLTSVNTLVQRLQSMEASRRQLLANLVHELGRPLGALQSAIQALAGGATADPELEHDLLAGMDDEVLHLRRLLNDLARLHDQAAGRLELARQPVALGPWIHGSVITWRAEAVAKGVRWVEEIPPDLPIADIDPDRLAQALGNLLSNAIRYTPPGECITVSAGCVSPVPPDGGGRNGSGSRLEPVWIRVSDTGPGIPVEEQALVFQPLYRGSRSQRFPQGMGLGLAIARDLVEAHRGRLEMTSAAGQGSAFTIWLPVNG